MQNDKTTPFTINAAQEVLTDLHLRLKNTRWSYQMEDTGWDAGTDLNYLKQLVAYWLDSYNWRERETALNQFHHFKTEVEGTGIHFIHERCWPEFHMISTAYPFHSAFFWPHRSGGAVLAA